MLLGSTYRSRTVTFRFNVLGVKVETVELSSYLNCIWNSYVWKLKIAFHEYQQIISRYRECKFTLYNRRRRRA